jgi:hypothetical protein
LIQINAGNAEPCISCAMQINTPASNAVVPEVHEPIVDDRGARRHHRGCSPGCYLLAPANGAPARLALEKRRIASQPGMTRETFSRVLAAVARHGLTLAGDTAIVTDRDAAQAQFRPDPLTGGPEIINPLPLRNPAA